MSRQLKKFIYGVFYLAVFGLILFGVWKSVFRVKPTCPDDVGDCGGAGILKLESIKSVGEIRVFGLSSGKAVLAAEIENPNADFGATFSYNFKIYDGGGNLLETIPDESNVYMGERKFIYAPQVVSVLPNISKVQIEFFDTKWEAAKGLAKPDLSAENILTEVGVAGIKVSGIIKNTGPFAAKNLEVIAFLSDSENFEIFASKTFIANLENFAEKPFVISFPADKDLARKVDLKATKVFVSVGF